MAVFTKLVFRGALLLALATAGCSDNGAEPEEDAGDHDGGDHDGDTDGGVDGGNEDGGGTSLLPRPPGELPRPPATDAVPDELRPPR